MFFELWVMVGRGISILEVLQPLANRKTLPWTTTQPEKQTEWIMSRPEFAAGQYVQERMNTVKIKVYTFHGNPTSCLLQHVCQFPRETSIRQVLPCLVMRNLAIIVDLARWVDYSSSFGVRARKARAVWLRQTFETFQDRNRARSKHVKIVLRFATVAESWLHRNIGSVICRIIFNSASYEVQ